MSRALAQKQPGTRPDLPVDEQTLLNAVPHALILVDADNRIVYVNGQSETFFQAGAAVLTRKNLEDVIAFGSPLLALVKQVRRTGAGVNEYDVDLSTPRHRLRRVVDIFATLIPEADGVIFIMLQQRNMAQMIDQQLAHRGAARSVTGLAAILAHEIKNPLSGVRGAAQLLEENLDEDDRALTRLICAETDRVCNLVDRMEDFGDERQIECQPVNIHAVLNHVQQLAETGFGKNIAFEAVYDPSLPSTPGSRDKLVQVFLNLVKNAAEAINQVRDDGRIKLTTSFRTGVRLSSPGARARVSLPLEITVTDNGPGIPESIRPYLFEPFVTSKPSGTGLGLALVAKIIGDHGGIIESDSKPGRTTFRVLLPMQEQNSEETDHD